MCVTGRAKFLQSYSHRYIILLVHLLKLVILLANPTKIIFSFIFKKVTAEYKVEFIFNRILLKFTFNFQRLHKFSMVCNNYCN